MARNRKVKEPKIAWAEFLSAMPMDIKILLAISFCGTVREKAGIEAPMVVVVKTSPVAIKMLERLFVVGMKGTGRAGLGGRSVGVNAGMNKAFIMKGITPRYMSATALEKAVQTKDFGVTEQNKYKPIITLSVKTIEPYREILLTDATFSTMSGKLSATKSLTKNNYPIMSEMSQFISDRYDKIQPEITNEDDVIDFCLRSLAEWGIVLK